MAAQCNGASPSVFFAWISAPVSTNTLHVSEWPYSAAACNGVYPSAYFTLLCSSHTDQSPSLNRNVPHTPTNRRPSIGMYLTHRPIAVPQ
eukprot:1189967-Prorocentrum_minimum.AAC.1